jgi:dihydrofolate synthase / folylpolyglutamate synthase
MTLDDWLARIERLHPQEIELGLERIRAVAERLALLRVACPVITVAGTNGKGSTVTLIERLARAGGFHTALYTSPHLLRFNERVRVDGEPASDEDLCRAFAVVEQARADIALTYFEFTTLAALWLFRQSAIDLLILEVGLGGRLDAVNIIDADVAVITSIGLDHQDWLGSDREQIGREKAGILRAGRPLLFAAADMPGSIQECADAGRASLMRAGHEFGSAGGGIFWQSATAQRCALTAVPLGTDNLAAAVQALALCDRLADTVDIAALAADIRLPGRCQHVVLAGADWYLDVGHNREALQRFLTLLPTPSGRRLALCAMLADKPAEAVIADFLPHVDGWYLAGLGGTRGRTAAALAALFPPTLTPRCFVRVAEAVQVLCAEQQPGDQVLVFGSFHTVAEAAAALGLEWT